MTVVWNGGQVLTQLESASDDAALSAARFLLQEANKTCPFEVGTLEQSGKAEAEGDGKASVSYNTIYAKPQHERTDYTHKGKGRAKWLEKTMTEQAGKLGQIIASELGKAV